jgi:lipoprotein-anchoring transpeptidase ErfK/SrfK
MSPHHGARAALACAVVVALGAVAGCGADTEPEAPTTRTQPAPGPAPRPDAPPTPSAGVPKLKGPLAFHVRHRTQLRTSPGGRVVATITTRTEFKSPRILAVAARKPGWVLVRTSVRRHHVGWLPLKAGALFSEPRTLVIDLSKRSLTVFHRGRRTDVYRVAIGTAATPTPRGTFAITDRLTVKPGTPYGCCILALTAHQPKIAQGWGGGDRVAIHATPDTSALGKRVSHGCIRGSNRALRRLMRQVRLGAPVTIHA